VHYSCRYATAALESPASICNSNTALSLFFMCYFASLINSHVTVVPAAVLKRAPSALTEVELHADELTATAGNTTTAALTDRYISSTVGSTSDSILSPKRASTAAATAVTAQPSSYTSGGTTDASATADVTAKHLLAGPWAKLQQVCANSNPVRCSVAHSILAVFICAVYR
jgi:hypothetical protein